MQNYDEQIGSGQLIFPAGVEEIEIVFALNEDYFEDDILNEERGFSLSFVSTLTSREIQVLETPFDYEVLDDEAIFGEWDTTLTQEGWSDFQSLFGAVNGELTGLAVEDIEEIIWEFEYEALTIEVVLKETEEVEDCGEIEIENKVIEIEADYDELSRDAISGEIVLEGEVEQDDGSEEEFVFEGEFLINADRMMLTLFRIYEDEESEAFTLMLNK